MSKWTDENFKACKGCGFTVNAEHVTCPHCNTSLAIAKPITRSHKKKTPIQVVKPSTVGAYSFGDYQAFSDNKVSKEEYFRYVYLYGLQQAGIIQNLELQVSYPLQERIVIPSRKGYKGFTQSAITYSPDFRYHYRGVVYIEEYKYFRKTKAGTPKPGITTVARNKIKALIDKYTDKFVSHEWRFVITAWNKSEQIYYAFNANGVHFEYDLANYLVLEKAS